jgi:capsular polysaccharide biosynthesis protein
LNVTATGGAPSQVRLDQAIELREDGDFEESAELFETILADGGVDAAVALEYAKTLRRLDRFADADRVLAEAMQLAPSDFELRRAWAELPRHEVNYEATIARGRILREMFPPYLHPGAWESLSVELDSFYEIGDWQALEQMMRRHWDDLAARPEMMPHGIAVLNKLFLTDEISSLVAAASAEAWAHLPAGARENLLTRAEIASVNLAAIEQTGVRVTSIGQNCLPYQLAGRWGLISRKADQAVLTPFDLGGFINDSAADAIASEFSAFERHEDYVVTKAWGGGKMYTHRPSGVGFFHERGTHWVTPDQGRFAAKIALMTSNWQVAKKAPRQLFVFCLCGAGDLEKLVNVVAKTLLLTGSHLLVVDVQQQRHVCPALPNVTYRHIPYPRDYDWSNVLQQCSDAGLRFERTVVEAIGWGIVKLNANARDMMPYLQPRAAGVEEIAAGEMLTKNDLVSRTWRFSNLNGHVLGARFSFGEDGRIEEYENENEASWRLQDGALHIYKRSGELMWRSSSSSQVFDGARQIRLGTHLNPSLDLYLTEILGSAKPAGLQQPRRYGGVSRVLMLSNGLDLVQRLGNLLEGAEIFQIGSAAEIDDHPDCNVFISGFELSHMRQPDDAALFVKRITQRFALSVFFELSSVGTAYLESFGLRSFHRDFAENEGVDTLSHGFISEAAGPGTYLVEHFADSPAFDSFKNWVVSDSHPPASMPSVRSRGDYRVFETPVFEYSIYVCHCFDALDIALREKFTLIESRLLRFRGEASGFRLDNGGHPRELGKVLYNTERDAAAHLRERPISMPVLVENDNLVLAQSQAEARDRWRAEFKIEIADLSVYEFENCVVTGTGSVFCEGKFVRGTDYLLMFLNSSSLDPIMRGLQKRHAKQHIEGVAIVGFNALYDNYYHWVAEAMAAISLCIDVVADRPLECITLITGKLNRFRREYLDILLQGDTKFQIVELERDEFVTSDTVIYCDNVGRTVHQQVCWEEVPFVEKIISGLGLQSCEASRMIYVARTDTAGRTLRNEAEIIQRLEAMGFEIFIGSQHSVAEQVKVFREARLIVAPHGAGLTNLLFCQPKTVVVEWQQSGYFNTGMMRLAQLQNLNYFSEMFFPIGGDEFTDDWLITIDRAIGFVGQLK